MQSLLRGHRSRQLISFILMTSSALLLSSSCWARRQTEASPASCRPPGSGALTKVSFSAAPLTPHRLLTSSGPQLPGLESSPTASDVRFRPETEARFVCDPGFLLLGDAARLCRNDGTWSESQPLCYLNVAQQSSVASTRPQLVDGDVNSWLDLLALFSDGEALLVDLFFVFPLLELRLVASYNLTGMNLQVRLSDDREAWIGVSMQVEAPVKSPEGLAVHTISLQNTVLRGGARYVKVSLLHSSGGFLRRAPFSPVWPLHELQIIADSAGPSQYQCMGDLTRSDVARTWAARGRCYHLLSSRANEIEANQICQSIMDDGEMFAPQDAELLDMIIDDLSHERRLRAVRWSGVWLAGPLTYLNSTDDEGVLARSAHDGGPTCNVLQRRGDAWVPAQTSCLHRNRVICQRKPRLCGSPPQRAGLLYQGPRFGPDGHQSAGVACGEPTYNTGQITCNNSQWTEPEFCDPHTKSTATAVHADVGPTPRSSGDVTDLPRDEKNNLVVTIAAVVGGAVILAGVAAFLVWLSRRRDSDEKLTHEPYNNIEFWEHNANPIYRPETETGEHNDATMEAIYEEPAFAADRVPPPPVQPPPLPSVLPPQKMIVPRFTDIPQEEDDYEAFENVSAPRNAENNAGKSGTSDSRVDSKKRGSSLGSRSSASSEKRRKKHMAPPPPPPPKPEGHLQRLEQGVREGLQQETEYAEPLVAGRRPSTRNSSLAKSLPYSRQCSVNSNTPCIEPEKDGPQTIEASDTENAYTLPYDVKVVPTKPKRCRSESGARGRREAPTSLPDVTHTGHSRHTSASH